MFLPETMRQRLRLPLRGQRLYWTSAAMFETAEFRVYAAIAHAGAWSTASPEDQPKHFEALTEHHRQLEVWAEHSPQTFENRAALVAAEKWHESRDASWTRKNSTRRRFDRHTCTTLFTMKLWLMNWRDCSTRHVGTRKFAKTYMRDARYCYLRWGAEAKVRQLDQLYPGD